VKQNVFITSTKVCCYYNKY